LDVGESGPVLANEENPGAIAVYLWEVSPVDAGDFADPMAPRTTFAAAAPANATIQLTARDGLYQVKSTCRVQIGTLGVGVSLVADPTAITVGESATLTCTNIGGTQAVSFVIDQLDGEPIEPTPVSGGVVTVTPETTGAVTFRCVGTSVDGDRSEPALIRVTVRPETGEGEGDNGEGGKDDPEGGGRP
jgi:hypothetical protein